jgi:hypothetical protein
MKCYELCRFFFSQASGCSRQIPIISRILEKYATRYSNVIILGDFNNIILADQRDFLDVLSGLGLNVVNSVQPTHFGQRPTLIDLFITNSSESVKLYSQIDLPDVPSRHDLI